VKTVRQQWEREEGPSATVIQVVASATDRDPLELPPLHDCVDADALDTIVASRDAGDVRVSFTYADVEVVVESSGWVEARPFVAERS
jgi:hypothetical protein